MTEDVRPITATHTALLLMDFHLRPWATGWARRWSNGPPNAAKVSPSTFLILRALDDEEDGDDGGSHPLVPA